MGAGRFRAGKQAFRLDRLLPLALGRERAAISERLVSAHLCGRPPFPHEAVSARLPPRRPLNPAACSPYIPRSRAPPAAIGRPTMPMNYARTGLLLAVLTAILVAMGAAVGGQTGLVVAFVIALVMNVVSLWKSDTMVLRMFKAEEVDERTAPDFVSLVRELSGRAGLPMPRVYIMNAAQPNAFATGRNPENAAVCASTGLLENLNREELAGVIAHELAHIKNRDTLTMAVAATIGGAVSMFAQYLQFGMLFGGGRGDDRGGLGVIGTLVAVIVAPLAAMMVQMAISRSREYQADRLGAMIAGNPLWLASALRKINSLARRVENPRRRPSRPRRTSSSSIR